MSLLFTIYLLVRTNSYPPAYVYTSPKSACLAQAEGGGKVYSLSLRKESKKDIKGSSQVRVIIDSEVKEVMYWGEVKCSVDVKIDLPEDHFTRKTK